MAEVEAEGKTLETPASHFHQINNGESHADQAQKISDYEQTREERIRENLQRMQKLGLVDLSRQVKSLLTPQRAQKNSSNRKTSRLSPLPSSGPPRRSSRLQNVTAVNYFEEPMQKKKRTSEVEDILLKDGSKPEFYTEKHEELLGSTDRSWQLFVDGCGNDGKRIYDPAKGKTCHQCRQKTLGLRTHCSQCNLVQGQFCGDCLYMRYGEHVMEANANPNWICPVCRGICNCSLCRTAKGWPPTGPLYKKITALGFRSVAHYLIQTRREQPDVEKDQDSKGSLPFPDISLPNESKESPNVDDNHIELPLTENEEPHQGKEVMLGVLQTQSEERVDAHNCGKENEVQYADMSLPHEGKESPNVDDNHIEAAVTENEEPPKVDDNHIESAVTENEEPPKVDEDQLGLLKPQLEEKVDDKIEITLEQRKGKRKPAFLAVPSPDSIALRLRQRKHNSKSIVLSSGKNSEVLEVKQVPSNVCSESKLEFIIGLPASTPPSADRIARRLSRCRAT